MRGIRVRGKLRPQRVPRALKVKATADDSFLVRRKQNRMVSRAARMLALAHHIEQLIEAGVVPSYAAAADALGLTRARLTQVMNLMVLAPKIQERLLLYELVTSERALRCMMGEASWVAQLAAIRSTGANQREPE